MSKNKNFKFTEKCLYEYRKNLSRLNTLREDLLVLRISGDVHAQTYDRPLQASEGSYSDPVFNHMVKIENLEKQVKHLERLTAPIENMLHILQFSADKGSEYNKILLTVMNDFYIEKVDTDIILDKLHYSRSTLYRKRCEVIAMVQSFLCL